MEFIIMALSVKKLQWKMGNSYSNMVGSAYRELCHRYTVFVPCAMALYATRGYHADA